MRVGFDYWQVLSHYPEKFKFMADAFIAAGAEVHVISAVGKNHTPYSVAESVHKLGFMWYADNFIHAVVF